MVRQSDPTVDEAIATLDDVLETLDEALGDADHWATEGSAKQHVSSERRV